MAKGKYWQRVQNAAVRIFPEHQIYFRTNGNLRFVTISTRLQLAASAAATGLVCWLLVASATYWIKASAISDKEEELASQRVALTMMQNRVQDLAANVADLQGDVASSAQRIRQRQLFLEKLFNNQIKVNSQTAEARSRSGTNRQQTAMADQDNNPVIQPYAALEREQVQFASAAARAADTRYNEIDGLLRRLGLNARTLVGQSSTGMGGPFVAASFQKGAYSALESQFQTLYTSWSRLNALQDAMQSVPGVIPSTRSVLTSGFGYRRDPFTGAGAMHTGIDFSGVHGSPIAASAGGVVTKAQVLSGYGLAVIVDHGRGISTLYGHMSRALVRVGEQVEAGQSVGLMGSTGRSTGTHLHYEVRINGTPVNPRPYLEASQHVLEIQDRAVREPQVRTLTKG